MTNLTNKRGTRMVSLCCNSGIAEVKHRFTIPASSTPSMRGFLWRNTFLYGWALIGFALKLSGMVSRAMFDPFNGPATLMKVKHHPVVGFNKPTTGDISCQSYLNTPKTLLNQSLKSILTNAPRVLFQGIAESCLSIAPLKPNQQFIRGAA